MQFPSPLRRGVLVQRYKRFFADVVLEGGEAVTAHCPNPGAMLGVNTPGITVWVSKSSDPKRKLAYTLELVETASGALTGINTMLPNRLVAEALSGGVIAEVAGYPTVRAEVKYGEASRVDFLLSGAADRPNCWLEVKNVHLSRTPGLAEFPDCVAARSTRHLKELEAMVALGERAVVLFVVQRMDCDHFSACAELDPAFATGLERAAAVGVEVLVYACDVAIDSVRIARPMPWFQRSS